MASVRIERLMISEFLSQLCSAYFKKGQFQKLKRGPESECKSKAASTRKRSKSKDVRNGFIVMAGLSSHIHTRWSNPDAVDGDGRGTVCSVCYKDQNQA
jgi:hypothetical protein